MKAFSVTGFLSLFFGTLAMLFTLQGGLIMFVLIFAMIGFLAAVTHIFLGTRMEMKMGVLNRGTVGMLFCFGSRYGFIVFHFFP